MAKASRATQEPPLVQGIAERLGPLTPAGSFQASDLRRLSRVDTDFGLRSLVCSNRQFRGQAMARPAPQLLPVSSPVSFGVQRPGYLAVQKSLEPQLTLLSRQDEPLCWGLWRWPGQ